LSDYDAIVLAVNHAKYLSFNEDYFTSLTKENALFYDVKGVFRNKISKLPYKSL